MFPEWTWIIGFWIGAAVGSFLNVVIYRLPRGLSVANPVYSFCPACKSRLTALDLVPLLSWLVLGRKCRRCGQPVSSRYFVVELVNGCLWACVWWLHLSGPETAGDPVRAVALMLFCSALVAAIFIDVTHYIIPDQVNAFMLVLGLAANGVQIAQGAPEAWTGPLPSSVAGALTGVGALWGIALFGRLLFKKDAMGHGDIKMARGIGAVLFPTMALVSFGLAVVIGALVGGWVVYLRWTGKVKEPEAAEGGDDGPYEPESVGSLVWCGLGYLLCADCVGLVWPRLYEWWFGEHPYSIEEAEEDPQVELTMIPFGPSLAAGSLAAVLFEGPLRQAVEGYLQANFGGP